MALALKESCHVCFTRDGGVIYDSRSDLYCLLTEKQTAALQAALAGSEGLTSCAADICDWLRETKEDLPPLFSSVARGLHDFVWSYRPDEPARYEAGKPAIALILWILLIQCLLKTRGIVATLRFVRKHHLIWRRILPSYSLGVGADEIMIASRFSPFRFECLEFSLAIEGYARAFGQHRTTFCLGLQRFPFIAHAWVELNDKPIGDDPSLRERAAIIYET